MKIGSVGAQQPPQAVMDGQPPKGKERGGVGMGEGHKSSRKGSVGVNIQVPLCWAPVEEGIDRKVAIF